MVLARFGTAGRAAALLLLPAAALAAAAGAWLQREEAAAERRLLEGRALTLAEALERSVGDAMAERRRERMAAILDAVARTEGVAGVAVAGPDGEIAFAAGEAPARVDPLALPSWSDRRLVVTKPIRNEESCRACHGQAGTNGTVLVSLDAAPLRPRLAAAARRNAVLAALAVTAFALAVVLVRRIQERNARLAEALGEATRAREARAADLQRLQAILDSMPDGVLFIDADDRIALVNRAGRTLRSLAGGTGRPLRECHPKAAQPMLDRVMGYLRNGDDAGPAHSIIKEREGRLETTYAPVRGADGGYLGTVMVIRDISERRTLERRLLDAERLSGLGRMSAQIAHELRNPLNAIGGAAQYLARRLRGEAEVAEYAALIGQEVERVDRFIAALLHVARPAQPVFAPVAMSRLLSRTAQEVALAKRLPADAVRLELASDVPAVDVDAGMVGEAVANLLNNAFEAGGESPPELACRYESNGGDGTIVVEVRDRGCGIPADQLDEVLRPFVTTKPTGTGLGLVVVTRAVEQHRARFRLARRQGGGTVATILFPVRRTAANPEKEVA